MVRDEGQARLWYGKVAATGDAKAGVALEVMQSPVLFDLVEALSPGDRSVLELATQMPKEEALKAGLMTMHGTANHRLWAEMAKLGWMAEAVGSERPTNKEAMPLIETICFKVLPVGLDRITLFLQIV